MILLPVQESPIIELHLHLWIFTCSFVSLMGCLFRIPFDINILWVALFISLSPSLILLMSSIFWVSLFVLQLLFILDIYFAYYDTYGGHHLKVYSMCMILHFSFMLTRTPLGRVTQQIDVLSLDIAFFLVLLLLHGSPRNKQLYLILVWRPNFEPLLLLLQRLYGFDGYWLIWYFLCCCHTSSLW
jgi:hypothetical protein